MKRILFIDVAKAICIVLVVIGHYVPVDLPQEFCLAQFKNMIVFFMLGVVAFEHRWLHRLVNGFSPVKFAVAVVLFVVAQSVNLSLGG